MNKRILTTSQRFDRSMRNPVSLFPHTRSISIARYYVLRFNYSTKLYGNCALFVGATPMIHGDFLSFFSIELYRAGSQFKYNTGEKNGEDLISFFSFFFFLFPFSFSIRFRLISKIAIFLYSFFYFRDKNSRETLISTLDNTTIGKSEQRQIRIRRVQIFKTFSKIFKHFA